MPSLTLRGRWALVTGASSGLGADLARELAARGCNLVLVARREERLQAVQAEIQAAHTVQVSVLTADLSEADAPARLFARLGEAGRQIDVLVNNAGSGLYGPFLETPWQRERDMLMLDILAVAHLTKLFLPGMVQRGTGGVLFVASIGAYQPSPLYASYSAAKSYVLHLGEALNYELRGSGVHCTVLSPGVTRTEFHAVAGQQFNRYQRLAAMDSATVARTGIRALRRGQPSVVAGRMNALSVWANRLLPRRASAAVAEWVMR